MLKGQSNQQENHGNLVAATFQVNASRVIPLLTFPNVKTNCFV